MYSFPNLGKAHCSMSGSNCCFLTCIQISQEAGTLSYQRYFSRAWGKSSGLFLTLDWGVRERLIGCGWAEWVLIMVPVPGLTDLWLKCTGQSDKSEIQQRRDVVRRKDNQDAGSHPYTYFESVHSETYVSCLISAIVMSTNLDSWVLIRYLQRAYMLFLRSELTLPCYPLVSGLRTKQKGVRRLHLG